MFMIAMISLSDSSPLSKECFPLEEQQVDNQTLAVDCCPRKAVLKINGEITAEKDLLAPMNLKKNEENEKDTGGWPVAMGSFFDLIFNGVLALIRRSLMRHNDRRDN